MQGNQSPAEKCFFFLLSKCYLIFRPNVHYKNKTSPPMEIFFSDGDFLRMAKDWKLLCSLKKLVWTFKKQF